MANFVMPRMGADMTEATLVAWKVKPGDEVSRGMVVAEVDTAKGVIEVECFQPGKVLELVAHEGELLPVGAVLARILGPGESAVEAAQFAGEHREEISGVATAKERAASRTS